MSGTGKSKVARTVAATLGLESNMAPSSNSLAASFFFSKFDDKRNTADHVFTTITRCFTLYRPALSRIVSEACAELDNIVSRGFSGLWDMLLDKLAKFVEASQTMRNTPECWLVEINALDECRATISLSPN